MHQRVGRGRCCRRGRLHAQPGRTVSDPTRWREGGTVRRASHDGISQATRRSLASVPRCPHFVRHGLTLRWSQRRLRLEFMDGLSYTTIIELAEPLACRRGSAWDRWAASYVWRTTSFCESEFDTAARERHSMAARRRSGHSLANVSGFARGRRKRRPAGAEQRRTRGLGRPSPRPAGLRRHMGGRSIFRRRLVFSEVDIHYLHDAPAPRFWFAREQ